MTDKRTQKQVNKHMALQWVDAAIESLDNWTGAWNSPYHIDEDVQAEILAIQLKLNKMLGELDEKLAQKGITPPDALDVKPPD